VFCSLPALWLRVQCSCRFFLPLPSMAAGVKWLFWINPSSYSYHVAAAIVFHCEGADCPTVQTVSSQGVAVQTVSDFMEQYVGIYCVLVSWVSLKGCMRGQSNWVCVRRSLADDDWCRVNCLGFTLSDGLITSLSPPLETVAAVLLTFNVKVCYL